MAGRRRSGKLKRKTEAMGCEVTTCSSCEIAGSTFEGRVVSITGAELGKAEITAVVKDNYGRALLELQGARRDSEAYFSFAVLEAWKPGRYVVEYWAKGLPDLGTLPLAVEKLRIILAESAQNGDCGC